MNHNKNTKRKNKRKSKMRLRRRFKFNKFGIAKYNQKTKPSTFGPGSYKVSLTKLFRGSLENQVNITLYSEVIAVNPEFDRVKNDFKYIKVEGIAVTFQPRNLPLATNQTPAYMILNYDGVTTKNIRLQDSAKVISAFIPKPKMFKFNIPKVNSFAGIMNGWYNIGDIAYLSDLMLQIHAPNNTSEWFFKIDIIVSLRGPTNEEEDNNKQETLLVDVIKRFNEKMKLKESGKLQLQKKKYLAELKSENALTKEKEKPETKTIPLNKSEVLVNDKITMAGEEVNADSSYDDDWGDL